MIVMARASFAAPVSAPAKSQFFSSDADQAQCAFGRIFVDGYTTASQEQAEGHCQVDRGIEAG